MPFSAKKLLADTKTNLERSALDKFGDVVDDFTDNTVLSGLGIGASGSNRNDGNWYATSYAAALAGATSYRPKLKFLFQVEFGFTPEAKKQFSELGKSSAQQFTFMIKSVDRPKIDFEYEEDVNMYNYRTKVLKKIRHRELTLVMMDDAGNRVFDLFRTLMMIHSPITRRQVERDLTNKTPDASSLKTGSGMSFSSNAKDNAHRAVVNSDFGNSIHYIRVKQLFVDPSKTVGLDSAAQGVAFDFMNPRISSFDFDELTHESSDPSLLTMVFDYDWLEMVKIGTLGTNETKYSSIFDSQKTPNITGAPNDIHPNKSSGATQTAKTNLGGSALNGVAGVLGKGASSLVSDSITKGIKSIAGNNKYASQIAGAISSKLASPIGSFVSGKATDLGNSAISGVQSIFSTKLDTSAVVSDSTTTSETPAKVSTSFFDKWF